MSVIKTNTVRDSKPLWRFGNMPLTMVSQTKSESGLTKEAMWPPIVSSIVWQCNQKFQNKNGLIMLVTNQCYQSRYQHW